MPKKKVKNTKTTKKKIVAKKPATKKKVTAEKKTTTKKKIAAKKVVKKSPKKIAAKKPITKKANAKKATTKEKQVTTKKKETEKKPVMKIVKTESNKKTDKKPFKIGEYAIYPSHGVGKVVEVEKTIVLDQEFSCYLIFFEKEKLTIKVPISNSQQIGLRPLATKQQMEEVLSILRSGVKKLKGMWSRRAQEYETKINSGDIILLAEVIRDLTRDIEDGDRSYSERIIYETAIDRLANEYAVIYNTDFETAKEKVVIVAKDKLNSDVKPVKKDDDDFDDVDENDNDDEEDDFDDYEEEDDDDFDDKPKKRGRG